MSNANSKAVRPLKALVFLVLAVTSAACSNSFFGAAQANCNRLEDAKDAVEVRCPGIHLSSQCDGKVLESDATSEEMDACVNYLQNTGCRELTQGDYCNFHWVML